MSMDEAIAPPLGDISATVATCQHGIAQSLAAPLLSADVAMVKFTSVYEKELDHLQRAAMASVEAAATSRAAHRATQTQERMAALMGECFAQLLQRDPVDTALSLGQWEHIAPDAQPLRERLTQRVTALQAHVDPAAVAAPPIPRVAAGAAFTGSSTAPGEIETNFTFGITSS
jgi:hypothetical protein